MMEKLCFLQRATRAFTSTTWSNLLWNSYDTEITRRHQEEAGDELNNLDIGAVIWNGG